MKRGLVVTNFVLVFVMLIVVVSAQVDSSFITGNAVNVVDVASVVTNNTNITNDTSASSDGLLSKNTIKDVEKTSGLILDGKWGKLGEQWEEFLINKTFVGKVDEVFKKADIVFFVLTGSHYKLSVLTFFAVLLWLFFFLSFGIFLYQGLCFSMFLLHPLIYIFQFAVPRRRE